MNLAAWSVWALGFVSVAQAGLNRRVGEQVGLPSAVIINNSVLLVTTVAWCIFLRGRNVAIWPQAFSPWFLLPGVLGLLLVSGIPHSIQQLGATRAFVPLMGAQILGSLLWDAMLEGKPVVTERIFGAGLALAGAVLVSRS